MENLYRQHKPFWPSLWFILWHIDLIVETKSQTFARPDDFVQGDVVFEVAKYFIQIFEWKKYDNMQEMSFTESVSCHLIISTPQHAVVMFCAIWYHIYNLKNVKNTHGGMLLLSQQLYQISTPPWMLFTFLKLSKWH